MGKVRSGAAGRELEGRVPFYRDGDLLVYAPVSGDPGKKMKKLDLAALRKASAG